MGGCLKRGGIELPPKRSPPENRYDREKDAFVLEIKRRCTKGAGLVGIRELL